MTSTWKTVTTLMMKSLIESYWVMGDEAMPALHFLLAETAFGSSLRYLSDDSASTCKGGEAGCACAGGHGEAHDEGDQVVLQCNDGSISSYSIRKCPKCGTYNGTRGLSCKNKQCDMVFKEAEQKNNKKFG